MSTQIIPYDIEAQKQAAAKLVESASIATLTLAAKSLEITDEETYQQAIDLRTRFAVAEKRITDFWEPLAKAANALHKSLTGARAEMVKQYSDGKALMTRKAETYLMEQQRAKREAEAAMARVADQQRRELEAEARRLATRGEMDRAEQIERQAQMSVAPSLPDAIPQAVGAKVGVTFAARVTDMVAVMKSIVEGQTPLMWEVKPGDIRPLVVIDEVVLRAIVSRQQKGLSIPGVVVDEGVRISSTGGR